MPDAPLRILLVEDNSADARLLCEALAEAAGEFQVTPVELLEDALRAIASGSFDAILLDLFLPDCRGIATVERTNAMAPHLPIIVMTGLDDEAVAVDAVRKGAQDFLIKGRADVQLLARAIRYAVERKRSEEEVRWLNAELERRVEERTAVAEQRAAQLRALTAELTQTEQRERRRLAQMLHDDLQQLLYAAKLSVFRIQRRLGDGELRPSLEQLDGLLDECLKESRTLAVDLSPPVLYDGGLTPALEWLARQVRQKHSLAVELQLEASAEPANEDVRVLLFQAVQELLFNVVKHAQTDCAKVEMKARDGRTEITVSDTGVGFDPAKLQDEGCIAGSFGLFSIRERLDVIGGGMEIHSAPGEGTRTTIFAPRCTSIKP